MTKSTKSHLRGGNEPTHCVHWFIPPLLKNTHRRLAATSANKVPRPSRYSITTATGSKRLSADSDLLLCHVRLRRTSRLILWCVSGCEHSKIGFILIVPSARVSDPRPPCTFSGRARGKRYIRERNALLYDFWYFSSRKSTIKEKYLYVSIQRQQAIPSLGDAALI